MVRLQCPHWALAAPAPRLSSPSAHPAVVRRFYSTKRGLMFNPRPCFHLLYWHSGLYWVMRASQSGVTPSPCCSGCWPRSATPGWASTGPQVENPSGCRTGQSWKPSAYNIQGVKQRDPSVLHDTVEAVEGEPARACPVPMP